MVWGLAAVDVEAASPRRKRSPAVRPVAVQGRDGVPRSGVERAVPVRGASGVGRVLFVTDQRAYLDRGRRDGLKAKQQLRISRAGRPVATCTVEDIAERQATCAGARLRPGDTFRVSPPPPAAKVPIPTLPAVTAVATLQERAAQIGTVEQEKVDFKGAHLFGGHTRVMINPAVVFWRTQSDPAFAYSVEQIDGAIRAYELGATGLQVDAAFSAMRWGTGAGSAGLGRFRPATQTQFYLWQAELSRRQADARTVFSAGRIWPWHLPGITLLDGFQVGRHDKEQTAEGGVYGGFLPTAVAVAPSAREWVAGLYGTLTQVGGSRGIFRLARQQARLGIWRTAGATWIAEGEGTGQVWLGPTSFAAGARIRSSGATGSGPVFERLFLDFGVRPTTVIGGGVHLRYFGVSPGPSAELLGEIPAVRGSVHAAADVRFSPWTWFGVAGYAGLNRDRESGRQQRHAAGEVRFPRLFGAYAGASLGAETQEGWLRARSLYTEVVGRSGNGIVAWARVSATATQYPTPVVTPELHELGGQLSIDGAIVSWLRARAWCALRLPWLIRGEPPPVPSAGLASGVGLRGVF